MPSMSKVSRFATSVMVTKGLISVVYHSTLIVDVTADTITLDTGGYDTVTTRRKMQQTANEFGLPYSVFRRAGVSYARSTLTGEQTELRGVVVLPRRVAALAD